MAIVNYKGFVYGLLVGWVAFGESQKTESLLGMLWIVGGVVFSVIYTKKQKDIEVLESTAG